MVSKPVRNGSRTKVVRNTDFNSPRTIGSKDMEELLDAHVFAGRQRAEMASFLNETVAALQRHFVSAQREPNRAGAREHLQKAEESLFRAQYHLARCGLVGRRLFRNDIAVLGGMFSLGWLRETFANDSQLPAPKVYYDPSMGPR